MQSLKQALPTQETQQLLHKIEKQVDNIAYQQAEYSLSRLQIIIAKHLPRESS